MGATINPALLIKRRVGYGFISTGSNILLPAKYNANNSRSSISHNNAIGASASMDEFATVEVVDEPTELEEIENSEKQISPDPFEEIHVQKSLTKDLR